jgi:hypothetical protein
MADAQQNQGFTLPTPNAPAPAPTPPSGQAAPSGLGGLMVTPPEPDPGGQPRDYAIGGGILLVLIVAFFFAKNAYSNHLATRKVPPGAANAAGWWLFILLSSLATASVLSIVNTIKFLTPLFMAPMGIVALVALVLMLMSGRRS